MVFLSGVSSSIFGSSRFTHEQELWNSIGGLDMLIQTTPNQLGRLGVDDHDINRLVANGRVDTSGVYSDDDGSDEDDILDLSLGDALKLGVVFPTKPGAAPTAAASSATLPGAWPAGLCAAVAASSGAAGRR